MMGLKVYLLIALAVSCHGLPRTTEEVVPERQTMLLQHTAAFTTMSPTAFISAMTSSGGTEATCRSFADETIKTIDTTVKSTQGEVDAIETGHSCAALGQDAVKAEEAKVVAAKLVVQNAKADVASKTDAKDTAASAPYTVTFDLMSTSQPNCLDVSGESSYLAVKNARDTAIAELEAAVTALTAANTKVTGTEASLATVVTEASRLESGCLCRIQKEQKAAWAAASTATAAHAADWKQAHEVICALDKTATCTVPSCPTVTQPTLAAGVANAPCENKYTCTQSYYCTTRGPWERNSAGHSDPETDVVEACNADPKCTGYTYNADHSGSALSTCYQTTYPGTGHQWQRYAGTLKLCQRARYQAAN
jgi:hypothetical protein